MTTPMSISVPIVYNSIGRRQKRTDPDFIARAQQKPGYGFRDCPNVAGGNPLYYEWAELKSSLLVQEIIKDANINMILTTFITNILKRTMTLIGSNYDITLDDYMAGISTSSQKDDFDNYPVAQTKAFIGNKQGLQTNFYAMYNFLKFFWIKMYDGKLFTSDCSNDRLSVYLTSVIIQDTINNVLVSARGRKTGSGDTTTTRSQIGISNINHPYLERVVTNVPSYPTEPWLHPGRVDCRMPFLGKYGELLEQYLDNNEQFASIQCGISGSTGFIVYMYLISIANTGTTQIDARTDVRHIILSAVLVLVGDGGHNIREVVTGLVIYSILLKSLLDTLKTELNGMYGVSNLITDTEKINRIPTDDLCSKFYTSIGSELYQEYGIARNRGKDFYCNMKPFQTLNLFKQMVKNFGYWEIFINEFYNFTENINPLGVFADDLDKMNPYIRQNKQNKESEYYKVTKTIYDVMFNEINWETEAGISSTLLFFGLDNNRYDLDYWDSFEWAPNTLLEKIVSAFTNGAQLKSNVETILADRIRQCNMASQTNKDYPYTKLKASEISLAFNSKRRSPKRKSPKRKSPNRKSPNRKSPKRKSPKRKSPKRKSPKRKSPKRKSPKRKSPKRKSPKRKSPKRKSPKRKSLKRKSPKRRSPKRKSPKRRSPKRKSPKRK